MDNKTHHKKVKRTLQITGISLIVIGLVFAIIGFVDFFGSMDGDDMPTKFWCLFVGMPVMMIGVSLTVFGFKRELSNYMKNEGVPVVNEASSELKPAITNITSAVKDALDGEDDIVCACGTHNDAGSEYCKNCGAKLGTITCPKCGSKIDVDSKFCNNCGAKLD